MKTTTSTRTIQIYKRKTSPQEKNDATLLEAIDAALAPLGKNITQTIYTCMEKTFKIKKQEILHKHKEFTEALEQMLGEGAKLIEIKIIEELHKRIKDFMHCPKKGKLEFTDYLTDLHAFLKLQRL